MQKILDQFEAALAKQGKSTRTRRSYMIDLADYASWWQSTYGETFNPAKMVRDDVRAYVSHLSTVRKAKPATVNRRLVTLRTFCRWAIKAGILKSDPTDGIKRAKMVEGPPKSLERSDLNRLVRKAQQSGRPLHAAIVTVMASTGLRVSELCALTMGDLEINTRSGKVIVREGKGGKYREVPLNADARRLLNEYLAVRPDPAKEADDYVFIGQRGEVYTPSGVWRLIGKYAQQAGVNASPHVLRHTFATLLLREGGADLVTVADLLGHEHIDTTARYTRSSEADRQAAVEKLII